MAVEQQVNDLFERGVRSEIVDIVAAIGQASDRAFDVTKLGGPDDDTLETPIDNGWQGFLHLSGYG